ncbi:MAG: acetyl-CoA carboxylase biotin carboxyl carrier protein [Candidatus Eremiobacteraeota bacterium]|nr:acetyl-CoA carboxylase biotin carboxyl carrier protein [Candidatus Eremiobacteraeota bacterium]MBV8223477.1 acetyl-CoA carboxylase biotin carboxyl carrier protein [Candidatus Eremiobacteraeota bacterium]
MDLNKKILDQLVELMQRDGLDRLRVRVGDLDVDLRMTLPKARDAGSAAASAPSAAPAPSPAGVPDAATPRAEAPPNVKKVLAPLVGVFYRSPAPNAAPFVNVGDTVSEGQVLCILEAMKLMNEIVSEVDGKIVKICANDADLAQLHQELFWIET